jgi:hypothetical protein
VVLEGLARARILVGPDEGLLRDSYVAVTAAHPVER